MCTKLQQLLMEVECSHVRKKTRQISLVLAVIFTQFEIEVDVLIEAFRKLMNDNRFSHLHGASYYWQFPVLFFPSNVQFMLDKSLKHVVELSQIS